VLEGDVEGVEMLPLVLVAGALEGGYGCGRDWVLLERLDSTVCGYAGTEGLLVLEAKDKAGAEELELDVPVSETERLPERGASELEILLELEVGDITTTDEVTRVVIVFP